MIDKDRLLHFGSILRYITPRKMGFFRAKETRPLVKECFYHILSPKGGLIVNDPISF